VLAVDRFQVFGPQHLVILGIFALGCLAAVLLGPRLPPRAEATVRRATGVVILVVCGPFEVADSLHAVGNYRTSLPLQICDFAWLIAGVALLTRSASWSTLLYYWGLTPSLQGVLTPDLDHASPTRNSSATGCGTWRRCGRPSTWCVREPAPPGAATGSCWP